MPFQAMQRTNDVPGPRGSALSREKRGAGQRGLVAHASRLAPRGSTRFSKSKGGAPAGLRMKHLYTFIVSRAAQRILRIISSLAR